MNAGTSPPGLINKIIGKMEAMVADGISEENMQTFCKVAIKMIDNLP